MNSSGISGTATIYDGSDAMYVILDASGLQGANDYPAHIHSGSVGSGGSIAISLNSVDATSGMSITKVTEFDAGFNNGAAVLYSDIMDFPGYINIHMPNNELTVVASVNVGQEDGGSITVGATQAYVTNGNKLKVDMVNITRDGWLVVHRDNGNDAPVVPAIISEPMMVDASTSGEVLLTLKTGEVVVEGEKVWVMLHYDSGVMGTYEFNGAGTPDQPVKDENGDIVMTQTTVNLN